MVATFAGKGPTAAFTNVAAMHEVEVHRTAFAICTLTRISFGFVCDPDSRFHSTTAYTLCLGMDAEDPRVYKRARKLCCKKRIAFGAMADQPCERRWHCTDPESNFCDGFNCVIV